MNLANKLTMLRIFLVPLFLIFIAFKNIPYGTIYKYLQKGAEIGLCDYDPKFSNKYKGNLDFVGTYIVEI